MGLQMFQVDAFTATPFAGNSAAVCLLQEPRPAQWMQQVAREMNLSETAFLCPRADGFALRWFTPEVEVPLCGHATLASAHVLWEAGHLSPEATASFHTQSGVLTATRQGAWISLDFPALPPVPVAAPDVLVQALRVTPVYVGENRDAGARYLVEVASEEIVRTVQPDFALLKTLPIQGAIVTSRASTPEFDCVSRYFAPRAGVNEDPVTGSAHCCLGPFWSQRLGQETLMAYQASARGGVLRVQVRGPRVLLGGQAVTVLRGELVG
ncbi:MAG: PhzF family phenazine biosynthesis protein [Candidatus Tectomicrobia bacterium]|uniref:PhzF family phenazine biosynthesis protein n=1 Tax=Tectimicrobiota bacterium TaxID=2528274 RepID=A0A937W0K3_UNCTE|nr:PhzF family phenazine biosynthesis protein [Candidatus Tectomicrobia bacterium]